MVIICTMLGWLVSTEHYNHAGAVMAESIICPKCSFEIEVTEVLATQLRARLQAEFAETLNVKEREPRSASNASLRP